MFYLDVFCGAVYPALVIAFVESVAEEGDDVTADIGGNVADAQFFMARMSCGVVHHWFDVAVKFIERANFLEHFFAADVDVVQAEKIVAVVFAFNFVDVNFYARIVNAAYIHLRAKLVMLE